MPTPQDRKIHKYILDLIENGEISGPVGYDLIDYINRLAVERCKSCSIKKDKEDND